MSKLKTPNSTVIPAACVFGSVNPASKTCPKISKEPPSQIDSEPGNCKLTKSSVLKTVIVKGADVAHKPAVGAKVYIVVAVLFNAGLHVPVIPFVEVVGKADKAAP